MDRTVERRLLQIAVLIGGFVPVLAGSWGVVTGSAMLGDHGASPAMDNHVRYLSGLLLGIGCGFWSAIPHIENKTARCRILTGVVFIGGLARLGGALAIGWPGWVMALAIGMELIVTPLLCAWQGRVAKRYGN